MKKSDSTVISIIIILVYLSVFPLYSNSLLFETSSGNLSGFDFSISESTSPNPTIPSNFVSGEYWSRPGFMGRLVYQGPANNPLTILNGGPIATSSNGLFYFTRVGTNGTPVTNSWFEYFLVCRVKGERHDGSGIDFVQSNYIIEYPGQAIPITEGAGFETVGIGELGYNTTGSQGIYNGTNGYIYLYKYKYLWIDFTFIRTNRTRRLARSYFQSIITIQGNGINTSVGLSADYNPRSSSYLPDSYFFGVERVAPEQIAFTELVGKTSEGNSYHVGSLRFHSTDWAGTVHFGSNLAGTETNFLFSTTINGNLRSFPYFVVFVPTIPSGITRTISPLYNSFDSAANVYVPSVIDTQYSYENVLQGEIRIFISPGTSVTSIPANTYSSIIYCFLTTN